METDYKMEQELEVANKCDKLFWNIMVLDLVVRMWN